MDNQEQARLVFRVHALRRMFQRSISGDEVREVVVHGETIREYLDDRPYPSRLVLKVVSGRPLHVVAARNPEENEEVVITAYEPDPEHWAADFKRKREP